MKGNKYVKKAAAGKVLAKAERGKLIYAHTVTTNSQYGIDTWQEYDSVEEAAKILGVSVPEKYKCRIYPPEFLLDKLDNIAIGGRTWRDVFNMEK